jgi:hypothetical protein
MKPRTVSRPRVFGDSVECPECEKKSPSLTFTPAGICLSCANDADPSPTVRAHSDPFWLLTPEEVERVEGELQRLDTKADQLYSCLNAAPKGSNRERILLADMCAVEREALLLHQLRAASRQLAPGTV